MLELWVVLVAIGAGMVLVTLACGLVAGRRLTPAKRPPLLLGIAAVGLVGFAVLAVGLFLSPVRGY